MADMLIYAACALSVGWFTYQMGYNTGYNAGIQKGVSMQIATSISNRIIEGTNDKTKN